MSDFATTQKCFVDYIKDPMNNPAPEGIEPRRLNVYTELFFNNVLGFVDTGFPVLKSLYDDKAWRTLVRSFFAIHQSRSPYFVDISKEFVEYLSNEYDIGENDPDFMIELAHYEWLELAMSVKKSQQNAGVHDAGSTLTQVCFSELATLAGYTYPVHQIKPDFYPQQSEHPIYILVYRKTDNDVGFSVVTDVTAHLITLMQDGETHSVESLIQQMSQALPQLDPAQVQRGTLQTLHDLLAQEILLVPNN